MGGCPGQPSRRDTHRHHAIPEHRSSSEEGAAWAETDDLASAAGVAINTIRPMTWQHLLATSTTPDCDSLPVHAFAQPSSRFCPYCLSSSGGRWQLSWRLRTAIACGVHGCLLADVCPRCRSPQRRHPCYRNRVPHLGHCSNRADCGHNSGACDYDLRQTVVTHLHHNHVLLIAQRRLDAMVGPHQSGLPIYGSDRPPALAILYDVGFLADLLVAAAPPRILLAYLLGSWSNHSRRPTAISSPTLHRMLGLATAVTLLSSENVDYATASLRHICSGADLVPSRRFGEARRSRLTPIVEALTASIHSGGALARPAEAPARRPAHAAQGVAARAVTRSASCAAGIG
ncbi:TniQ family protein [Mycolicibacterium fortuitum]|uniref:TniQ family protein n=1 Tax=Mycolicibacterium fortuitum TaxID=1766 RepID=UPI000944EEF8|nr:TniQ family protein [Mycolicibacterium fortuitum]